jgi:hypothetical protein
MPNLISKYRVLGFSFEAVTSGGTGVKTTGLRDCNPFTQWVVQQTASVWLQHVASYFMMCNLSKYFFFPERKAT